MINDYETDLPIKISEYSNLTMLNLLAIASERMYYKAKDGASAEIENI